MKEYDVIVVGGGGGTKFVRPAVAMGLSVAIVEKEDLGGTCLNRGCIPSKMLIHPANMLESAKNLQKYGISGGKDFAVDFSGLVERVSQTVDSDSAGIAESYSGSDVIDYYHDHARFVSDKVLEVGGEQITGQAIFIATGSRPLIPDIPGIVGHAPGDSAMPYMTSREALRHTSLPEKLLVIGGGYIGCELGHVYHTFGAQTRFFVRSKYVQSEDETLQNIFQERFCTQHQTHFGTKDLAVDYAGDKFTLSGVGPSGQKIQEAGDALLVATGVIPNTDDLGLEHTSITVDDRGYIHVNEYLETAVEGVFALGDCIGKYLFRHSVNFEAEYLVESLFENPDDIQPISYPPMPHAMFTSPEMAGVGLTEQDARERGVEYVVATHEYEKSAQGMARLPESGIVKLIFDRESRQLIGAHILGEESATMLHQLIQAMTLQATVDDLLKMIYIHPALPEIVRNAARTAKEQW